MSTMSNRPLPTGDEALALELAHLFVSAPMRLETPRRTEHGMPPLRVLIGGVSIDNRGWLYAWVAYVPSPDDVPSLSVWPVAQTGGVPFSAVLYDAHGHAFTYTSPKHLVFVRAPIRVASIAGGVATLRSGPPPGTAVVTVGAPELLGTEYGVEE